MDSRPPGGALKTVRANTDKVEALRVTNQHLLKELEQLTGQIRRPQETRQPNKPKTLLLEENNTSTLVSQEADREGETSHTREHDYHQPPGEDRNEERSWEQRFKDIQQEISHMKVAVKGELQSPWMLWYNKPNPHSPPGCCTSPSRQSSECRRSRCLMGQKTP